MALLRRDTTGGRPAACLDDNQLAELAQGAMARSRRLRALAHIDECDDCRAVLSVLARELLSSAGDRARSGTAVANDAAWPMPAPGTTIGRYIILSTLGQGGMGVVYAAYDPALDRKIALKLIRPELIGSTQREVLRERLVREAQAMARLSHPNVATVYDTGEIASHVFIAMEFVQGDTIRTWLERDRRSLRDIIGVFVAAGRGLAAAHAMGIVHRDFKPENVLCGPRGQVAVTDFGLAQWVTPVPEPGPTAAALPGGDAPDDRDRLTRTGALLGTPAYLAPEQRLHRVADARSDQFAFAVSLYEAVYRRRPWRDTASADHTRVDFPASPAIPTRLRQALRTALAVDPARRFTDMDALLRALSTRMRSRRRLVIVLAAAALGAASIGLNITRSLDTRPTPLQACLAGRDAGSALWDPAAAETTAHAFRRASPAAVALADATAATVGHRLDQFAAAWSSTYTTVCTSSWQRGEQSPSFLDARLACLELARDQAARLVGLFATADAKTVEKAVELTGALDATDCLAVKPDPQRMALAPAMRVRVQRMEREVADAGVQIELGSYAAARTALDALWTEAEPSGFHPLLADILRHRGLAEDALGQFADAERSWRTAAWHASAGDAPELELLAWAKLAHAVGYRLSRFAEAEQLLPRATALLIRLGAPARLELAIVKSQGAIYTKQARHELALATFERGIALARKVYGPRSPDEASLINAAGNSLEHLGRYPDATARYREALAIQRDALSEHHPALAQTYTNLAVISTTEGRFAEARGELQTALDLVVPAIGRDAPQVAELLEEIALAYQQDHRDREALDYHQQAIAIAERRLGPDDSDLARYRGNLALVWKHLGRFAEARRLLEGVLAIETRISGPDHPHRATTLLGIAQVLHESGQSAAALPYARQARAIYERMLGAAHPHAAAARETEADILETLAAARRP
jgi:tetratricopeptide (TPR) repeat protein/predicted Ser/Thr protein kinase